MFSAQFLITSHRAICIRLKRAICWKICIRKTDCARCELSSVERRLLTHRAMELCHSRILSLVEWMRTICLPRPQLCERESAVGTEEFQCQLMQRIFLLYLRNFTLIFIYMSSHFQKPELKQSFHDDIDSHNNKHFRKVSDD